MVALVCLLPNESGLSFASRLVRGSPPPPPLQSSQGVGEGGTKDEEEGGRTYTCHICLALVSTFPLPSPRQSLILSAHIPILGNNFYRVYKSPERRGDRAYAGESSRVMPYPSWATPLFSQSFVSSSGSLGPRALVK